MIKHIQCNIFDSGADVICHQVNCKGEMNSGIAKQVKERYPWVFAQYAKECEIFSDVSLLGTMDVAYIDASHAICSLFAQEDYGYDGKCYTVYNALKECMQTVRNAYPNHTIAIPYLMGCHKGGGDWNTVNKIIEKVFADYPGTVLICEYNGEPKPFDPVQTKNDLVDWIRRWFTRNGPNCHAVVGLSGGKDSTVVAALCKEALGKDRVLGVMMPNGAQYDIGDSRWTADILNIKAIEVNIKDMYDAFHSNIDHAILGAEASAIMEENVYLEDFWDSVGETSQSRINLPPRIRMTTLYAIAQMLPNGGRVANTCNLSEDYIGYSTRWGDSVGDFSPLANLTSEEVVAIGDALGLPEDLTHKTPSDGLCGKPDEDNFGFTYAVLNKYIRTGICEDKEIKAKIDALHQRNLFKLQPIPTFSYILSTKGAP